MDNTSDIIFEVFKEISDHTSWEKQVIFARKYPGFTSGERKKLEESLKFLQLELGNNFLRTSSRNHPLVKRITEKAPWRGKEVIAFVDTLMKLKQSESNYQKLHSKMVSMHDCDTEAIPFTDIAAMYLKAGFNVTFLDEVNGQKSPDMQLSFPDVDQHFYIEVSKLGESNERKLLDGNYKALYRAFNYGTYTLPFSCSQLEYITPEEMPAVMETITAVLERAFLQKEFVCHTDRKIRLAVAHGDKYEELEKWINTNDYRKGLLGVPLSFNETARIANYKIPRKARQIPADATGLIYLPVNTLYFWNFDLEEAVSYFQHKMKGYSNLLGIVVYGYLIHDTPPFSFLIDDHFYSIKNMNEAVIRHLCFVRNDNYKGSLPSELLGRIYQSFE